MTCRFDPHVPLAAASSAPPWPVPRQWSAPQPSSPTASIGARIAATTAATVAEHTG
jgi:hypothetical protein